MSQQPLSGFFEEKGISEAALAAYREGRKATISQDYLKAIMCYTDALSFEGTPDLFNARTFEYRGECHWLLGDLETAEQDYLAALSASDDGNQIARARVRLGELADFRGRFLEAEALYRQALAEGVTTDSLLVIAQARRGLGVLNRRQGNTEKAITHLTQALIAFRQAGEARSQAQVLTNLGRTRQVRGEYQHALTAHREALAILKSLEDRWRIVQSLNDIGECHQSLYDYENALRHHRQGLQLAHQYGANLLKPELQRNLGVDLVEQDRYEEGVRNLQEALKAARTIKDREQEALALYNLATAYLGRSCIEKALQAVSDLDQIADELNVERYKALASYVRGELLFLQGERAAAVDELNSAMLAAQTSIDRGVLWKLHASMSQVVDNEAIASVHRTIAAEFIRQTAEPLQDAHLKSCFVHAAPVMAVLGAAGIDPESL
jgi:tetratricopeptide (TPR) repeat protein